jgi:hypothetical protein
MASLSAPVDTLDFGSTPRYTDDPHAPRQVLPSQYHVRLFLHFVHTNLWKPHEPFLVAPYVPLHPHGWHFGVIPDGNQANDLVVYKCEAMVYTPEYPCRPYCCRHLFADLWRQEDDDLDLAEVLRFATTAPWSRQPGLAGISANIVYFRATDEHGVTIEVEQALPACDQGGIGMAPHVDLDVYFSPEWRLWQPLPLNFTYEMLPMPDEGSQTRRVRDVARARYCHEVVEDRYYGW